MQQEGLWGLKAICAYMGWRDRRASQRALERAGFPMFRCRRTGYARPVWHTNSELIQTWTTSRRRADQDRLGLQELLEQELEKKGCAGDPHVPNRRGL